MLIASWFLVVGACIQSESVVCGADQLCPAGTMCRNDLCVDPAAVTACDGKADNASCGDTAICHGGVCTPIECGNGFIDPGEQCDDHNQTAGDGCSADCSSTETCGNGVRDGNKFEECDDGNLVDGDGCDSRCERENAGWSSIAINGITQRRAAMTYDSDRGVVVLFGGLDTTSTVLADTWLWNGKGWRRAAPHSSPPARTNAAITYDSVRHEVVLFGGLDVLGRPLNDTWLWDGQDWHLAFNQTIPTKCDGAAMAFDTKRGRAIMFGGNYRTLDNLHYYQSTTWAWDGADWTDLAPATAPTGRTDVALSYDPLRDTIVMVGGTNVVNAAGSLPLQTWTFDGTTWHATTPAGQPSARFGARMAWDAVSHTTLLFGGNTGTFDLSDGYQWNGSSWTAMAAGTRPTARSFFGLASDPAHGTLALFGGTADAKTWKWTGAAWQDLTPTSPGTQSFRQVAFDRIRGVGVMADYGTGRTLESDGSSWTFLTATVLGNVTGETFDYDPVSHHTLMFGGMGDTTDTNMLAAWDGAAWKPLAASPAPAPRSTMSVAYDDARHRLVMFGGGDDFAGQTYYNDTWEWDGTAWIKMSPAHVPPAYVNPAMGYDKIHHVVVMFGGYSVDAVGATAATWIWDGTDWTNPTLAVSPPPRQNSSLVWHPRRQRLLLANGATNTAGDTWEWTGTAWEPIESDVFPSARTDSAVFPSQNGDLVLWGGRIPLVVNTTDSWELSWSNTHPKETCEVPLDLDGDGLAGCADPDCFTVCNPTCLPGTTCDAAQPHCGDGVCDPLETCRMCPGDCGACPAMCGDTFCDAGETAASCPGDCH